MIKEIIKQPKNAKLSLLIRHADRDQIPEGSFGNEVLLNEKGILNSLQLGESLVDYKINKIFSSPVLRCIQTAEYISKGYGKQIEIIHTTALGNPGLHILDDAIAGEFYLQNGFHEMYRRFMNGIHTPGVPDIATFQKLMTEFLKLNTSEKGITIFVTHDSLIAFYAFCLKGTVYTKQNWINYLTEIILSDKL